MNRHQGWGSMFAGSVFLLVLGAGCATATVPASAPVAQSATRTLSSVAADAREVTFLVFGDSGTGKPEQAALGEKMYEACRSAGCSFALVLGDNIYEFGVVSALETKFQTHFEKPYEKFGRFDFWVVAGNHDHRGSVRAAIEHSSFSDRWRMPFYHYAVPGLPEWVSIYGLDTEKIDTVQAQLAERALCGKRGWRFLFGHHPIHSNGGHGGDGDTTRTILPVIRKCGVQAYFAGHDHHQEHISAPGFEQFLQGAAAKLREVKKKTYKPETGLKQNFAVSEMGFAIVHLTETRMQVTFHGKTGAEIYRWFRDL
jgi:tartrate-resistant acid phosphatase type 5